MFYKLDMAFENEKAVTATLGNIKMYFLCKNIGEKNMRIRGYGIMNFIMRLFRI